MVFGGHQESGIRPGTEVTPLAAGMSKALQLWRKEREELTRRITSLRDRFEAGVLAAVPGSFVHAADGPEAAKHLEHRVSRLRWRCAARRLDLAGVCASLGRLRQRVIRAGSGSAGDGVFAGDRPFVAAVQRGVDEYGGGD